MTHRILSATIIVLVLVSLSCSLGGLLGGEEPPSSAPPDEGEGAPQAPADAAPPGSGPSDIPVYPGATMLGEVVQVAGQYGTEYELAGSWGYETTASVDEVADFYLAEMPKSGWEKIMHMSMGPDSTLSVWEQGGGQLGGTINIGKQENGRTHIAIVMAKKRP